MIRNRMLALALLALLCTPPAFAQDDPDPGLKASALRDACQPLGTADASVREAGETLCQTYLRGVADGLFLRGVIEQSGTTVCLPKDGPVSPAEAKEEFMDYLAGHPEVAQRSAGIAATFAIVAAHPCD